MFRLLWQIFKYGVIGVLATLVQTGIFYALATTCLKCLTLNDIAVKYLGLAPVTEVADGVRAFRFAVATGVGFFVANVFCWFLNRAFVFRPGRHRIIVEFLMFFSASAVATAIALAVSSFLISAFGLMTTLAVVFEVVISFLINFVVRKYLVFKE